MNETGYFKLNGWRRPITTASPVAQRWFDRGLNWTYGYNHEEASACFRAALEHDPGCAMAWWGIAYVEGPFYNRPWYRYTRPEAEAALATCHDAAQRASALSEGCSSVERGLIAAIGRRYPQRGYDQMEELLRWHDAYTDAMRALYHEARDDLDVAAIFVEAAVTRTPRRLWDIHTGAPLPGADTLEALAVLERALAQMDRDPGAQPHPGILHMYIHALEMAQNPEKGLKAADALRDIARDEGHFHHMPAHIYAQCGDYVQSISVSNRAIAVDDAYAAYAGGDNFYTTARCHDMHLLMFVAMFLGQYRTALAAADKIASAVTPDLLRPDRPFFAQYLDGYSAMRTHVQVRFGRWRELTREAAPPIPALSPLRNAMHHYGRAVAHAALGEIPEAEAARRAFDDAVSLIPSDAIFLSNTMHAMLGVAEAMIEGELEYRKRNYARAFAALRRAVERDDALNYTEPWAWMHPPRHALGALLAEQGHFVEAEQVYREDLGLVDGVARCCQHPDNAWAMAGLLECVERDGREGEAVMLRQRLALARARADVVISSSCCCRGGP